MLTNKHALQFDILLELRDLLTGTTFTHDQADEVLEDAYYDVVRPNRKHFSDDKWENPNHDVTNLLNKIADSINQFSPETQNKKAAQRLGDIKHEFKILASRNGLIGKDRPLLSLDTESSVNQYHFLVPGIPYDMPENLDAFHFQSGQTDINTAIYYDPTHYGAVHFVTPSNDDYTRYQVVILLQKIELANIGNNDTPDQLMDITTLERDNFTHIIASPMTHELAMAITKHSYDSGGRRLSDGFPVRHDCDQRVYWSILKVIRSKPVAPSYAEREQMIIRSNPVGHLGQLRKADTNNEYVLKPYGPGSKKHPWCPGYQRVINDETNAPFNFLANQFGVKNIDALYETQRQSYINNNGPNPASDLGLSPPQLPG